MGMKKRSSPHKKRTTARRKKRAKQRKQASLQERLARLAKTQNPIASLTEALSKAPHSTLGLGKPEPEERRRRPKLGKPLLSTSINRRDFPHYFGPQQPSAQQPGSVKISLSLPQRLFGARQIEFAGARRASALLWEKVPRRQWHYQRLSSGRAGVPLFELSPRQLTQAGGPALSLLSDPPLSAARLPTFSYSITLKPPSEKLFHQDDPHWQLSHHLSSANPSRKGSYQINLTVLPLKPQNSPLGADSPPETGQLTSKDKKGDIEHEIFVFNKNPQEIIRSNLIQTSQSLMVTNNSIRAWNRVHKNSCFRKGLARTKNRRYCLGQPRASCKSRGVGTGNLFDRKQTVGSRRLTRQAGFQQLLRALHEENNYDRRCALFTRIASAAISRRRRPRVQPSSDAAPLKSQNPGLIADSLPQAEPLFSEDKKGDIEHKQLILKIHPQETVSLNLNPATQHSRKTGDFIKRAPEYETSAPRETLPEKVRSTQARHHYSSILNSIPIGEIPIPEDISPVDLAKFIQQFVQKIAALTSLMELGDGCNNHQIVKHALSSRYADPWFSPQPLFSADSWNR